MIPVTKVELGRYSAAEDYTTRVRWALRGADRMAISDIMGATNVPYTTVFWIVFGFIATGQARLTSDSSIRARTFAWNGNRAGRMSYPAEREPFFLRQFSAGSFEERITRFMRAYQANNDSVPITYICGATGISYTAAWFALNSMPKIRRTDEVGGIQYYLIK